MDIFRWLWKKRMVFLKMFICLPIGIIFEYVQRVYLASAPIILIHEGCHFLAAIYFGYLALPSPDIKNGGGYTIYFTIGSSLFHTGLSCLVMFFLVKLYGMYSGKRWRLFFATLIISYPFLVLTSSSHIFIIEMIGFYGQVALGFWLLYLAFNFPENDPTASLYLSLSWMFLVSSLHTGFGQWQEVGIKQKDFVEMAKLTGWTVEGHGKIYLFYILLGIPVTILVAFWNDRDLVKKRNDKARDKSIRKKEKFLERMRKLRGDE